MRRTQKQREKRSFNYRIEDCQFLLNQINDELNNRLSKVEGNDKLTKDDIEEANKSLGKIYVDLLLLCKENKIDFNRPLEI